MWFSAPNCGLVCALLVWAVFFLGGCLIWSPIYRANLCNRVPFSLMCDFLLYFFITVSFFSSQFANMFLFSKFAVAATEVFHIFFVLYRVAQKERNSRYSRFSGLCSNQQLLSSLFLDRASISHYNNIKIIKFGWELFILWDISYGLSFSWFAGFPEFRGTMTN